jgi:hypothetical protein
MQRKSITLILKNPVFPPLWFCNSCWDAITLDLYQFQYFHPSHIWQYTSCNWNWERNLSRICTLDGTEWELLFSCTPWCSDHQSTVHGRFLQWSQDFRYGQTTPTSCWVLWGPSVFQTISTKSVCYPSTSNCERTSKNTANKEMLTLVQVCVQAMVEGEANMLTLFVCRFTSLAFALSFISPLPVGTQNSASVSLGLWYTSNQMNNVGEWEK